MNFWTFHSDYYLLQLALAVIKCLSTSSPRQLNRHDHLYLALVVAPLCSLFYSTFLVISKVLFCAVLEFKLRSSKLVFVTVGDKDQGCSNHLVSLLPILHCNIDANSVTMKTS